MSQNTYDHHKAAFANVGAYVVMKDGSRVASVAFKYPRDGASRLWCYFHIFGTEMQRGHAGGYGYDKASAAVESAVARIKPPLGDDWKDHADTVASIQAAMASRDGWHWDRRLDDAGFTVLQAV